MSVSLRKYPQIKVTLDLDAELFRIQRSYLGQLIMSAADLEILEDDEIELLQGIEALLDSIADQAHDKYGLPTLFSDQEGELV